MCLCLLIGSIYRWYTRVASVANLELHLQRKSVGMLFGWCWWWFGGGG